jgi:hypothetical protein
MESKDWAGVPNEQAPVRINAVQGEARVSVRSLTHKSSQRMCR